MNQRNKQASKQANKQINKQTNKQMNKQTNKQTKGTPTRKSAKQIKQKKQTSKRENLKENNEFIGKTEAARASQREREWPPNELRRAKRKNTARNK